MTKRVRVLSLLFFIVAIFARHSTGAPNAEVAFTTPVSGITYSISDSLSNAHDSVQLIGENPGSVNSVVPTVKDSKEHSKNYKKYISPDRSIDRAHTFRDALIANVDIAAIETWSLSHLPRTKRAQAPPMTGSSTTVSSPFTIGGVSNFESINPYKRSWGIGLDGLRTTG